MTVHQPWAWAIIHGGKDVENRGWTVSYRGPLLIHAGKKRPSDEDIDLVEEFAQRNLELLDAPGLVLGAIIGHVRLVDVVRDHPSTWTSAGAWQWVLKDPVPIDPPVVCRGGRSLFVPRV